MRPRHRGRGRNGLGVTLVLFPLSGTFFGRSIADLLYMAVWPFLLMLLFSSLKVVRYPAMNDFVANFELVFEGIAIIVGHIGLRLVTRALPRI